MHWILALVLSGAYALLALYAAVCWWLAPFITIFTVALGGLPMFLWMAVEASLPPVAALSLGVTARWFPITTLLLSTPLVVACIYVAPMASSGSAGLGVGVPWLSAYEAAHAATLPKIEELLRYWLPIYGLIYSVSLGSRLILPIGPKEEAGPSPSERMHARLEELRKMTPERELKRGKSSGTDA